MPLSEYILLFAFVVIMGAGLPGPGEASLIAAGTPDSRSGLHRGRQLLDHPGRLEKSRRKLLVKGDGAFGRHTFAASVTMPAFVSGIFRVRSGVFVLGAFVAGVAWIGMYVGLAYFFGAEIAERIGDAGSKVVLGVIVAGAIGLGARTGLSAWRSSRRAPRLSPATSDDLTGRRR